MRPPNCMKASLISSGEEEEEERGGNKQQTLSWRQKNMLQLAECTHCSARATTANRTAVEHNISGLSS